MSRENVEIVRRVFTAFSRGDATAMLRDLDRDVVLHVEQAGQSGESSGAPMEGLAWFVCQMREGEVVRIHVVTTEQDALEAVGLRE